MLRQSSPKRRSAIFPGALLAGLLLSAALHSQNTGFAAADAISRENRARSTSLVASGVDLGTGAFVFEKRLLSVTGIRALDFAVSYNSLLTTGSGALGPGWGHNYEVSIDGDPETLMTVHWGGNRQSSFRAIGGGYEPTDIANRYDKLERNTNSWDLTLADGTRYQFRTNGRMLFQANKIGQQISVGYDADGVPASIIEPPTQRRITFNSRAGRLRFLQDAEDRVVFFEYGGGGRLAAIHNPAELSESFASTAPRPIPDNDPDGLTLNINVDREDEIGLVLLDRAVITHPRLSDLTLFLTSPNGTRVRFQTNSPDLTWDLSETLLSNFAGENPDGLWRVTVIDDVAGETGTLNSFRIKVTDPTDPVNLSYNGAGQLTRANGPSGERILENVYDSRGRIVAQDDGRDDNLPAMFTYEERQGRTITTYSDRVGAIKVYEHDSDYNLTSLTDAIGETDTFAYDSDGNRTSMTDALGRTTIFRYDSLGNLVSVTDPVGATTNYDYDNRSNLTRVTDALGQSTEFTYDSKNNITKVTDGLNHEDTHTIGGSSQVMGTLLEDGAGVDYAYTEGRVTSSTHPVHGRTQSSARYDNIGRLTQIRDAVGFNRFTTYNANDEIIEEINEEGARTATEYDSRGRMLRVTKPGGITTEFSYDGNGNLASVTNAAGDVKRFEYDGEDRIVRVIRADGGTMQVSYDASGRVIETVDALGNTRRFEYDKVDNQTAQYDGKDELVRSITYDDRDLPIRVTDAHGASTELEYDATERLVRITNALGEETSIDFDALDREVGATDALGRTTSRSYLQDDVTSRIEDASGKGVSFQYDPANRMTRISHPWGTTTRLDYDERDFVDDIRFPSGRRLQFNYDGRGQVTRLRRQRGTIEEPTLIYEYDDNSNLLSVRTQESPRQPVPAVSYEHDDLSRVTRYTDIAGDSLQYQYDEVGNLTQLTYPDGKRVTYEYDLAGQLTDVTDWDNRKTTYSYDENSRVTRVEFPNGARRVMTYDKAGQIIRRRDLARSGAVIVDYKFSYDPLGQVQVEASGPVQPPFRPQVTLMTYSGQSGLLATFNGQNVSYDRDGRLETGPLGNEMVGFQYDATGNLIVAGLERYTYDAEDRLRAFLSSGQVTSLTLNPIPEFSQVLVSQRGGTTKRYVWGVGLIYEETPDGLRVHHYDHRGSTVAMTDDSGEVVGRRSFGPFGEAGESTGEIDSIFQYNALFGVLTVPNGLRYMRFRWYSPQLKRFLSPDSQYGDTANPASLNLFSYARNNPININDPTGRFGHIIAGAVAGAAVGAVVGVAFQGISDIANNRKPQWEDYAAAAIGGAVGGAISGGLLAACAGTCGPLALAAGGAVSGAADGALTVGLASAFRGEDPDWDEVAEAALIGAVVGGVLGGVAGSFGDDAAKGGKAAKAAGAADDAPPPRGILKNGKRARRPNYNKLRYADDVQPNGARRASSIASNSEPPPTRGVKGNRIAADAPDTVPRGRQAQASRARLRKANNRPPARSKPKVRQGGRSNVNKGRRGTGGEAKHTWRWEVDLRRAGKAGPNSPRRNAGRF